MDTIDVEILATVVNNGTGNFDELTNRPKYNGTAMTHATDIPEVKTVTWDGKYTKPASGIPSTDMTTAVQTSLAKADSAIQEHQSLSAYRTAAAQDVIDAAKYSKPATGIPKTDMASDVQTSLGKADSAIQEHQSLAAYRTSAAQDVIDTALSDSIDEKYEKPAAGIPKTDLAEAVQTSLGKADSALQEHQSLSAYRTASAQDTIDATKAAASDLTAHTGNTSNPHSVTAEQTAYDSAATSHTSGSVAAKIAEQSEQIVTLDAKLTSKSASASDVGKFAKISSVADGKITGWEFGEAGGGGTSDFEQLSNRPKYNSSTMTGSTNIPEVKTATWDAKYDKPASGIPSTDMTTAVQTSLGKADSALQEHQSLAAYRTASAQDEIDANKASASDLTAHTGNTANPHSVTAEQTAYNPSASSHTAGSAAAAIAAKAEQVDLNKTKRDVKILQNLTRGVAWSEETGTTPAYQHVVATGAMGVEVKKIGGRTIRYNQLVNVVYSSQTVNGITFTRNNNGSWTLNGTATALSYINVKSIQGISGHKYYLRGGASNDIYADLSISSLWGGTNPKCTGNGSIGTCGSNSIFNTEIIVKNGTTVNNVTLFPIVMDLTAMFGAGNEPATVQAVKAIFPLDYYPYSTGAIVSANTESVVSSDDDSVQIGQISIPQALRTAHPLRSAGSVHDEYDLDMMKFVKRIGTQNVTGSIGDAVTLTGCDTTATTFMCAKDIGTLASGAITLTEAVTAEPVYFALSSPTETDISSYFPNGNVLETEAGGTLTFTQDNVIDGSSPAVDVDCNIPIPNGTIYMVQNSEA